MRRGAGIYLVTRIHGLRTHLMTTRDIQFLAKAKNLRQIADSLMKTDYAIELGQIPTHEQDAATLEGIFLQKLVDRFFFVRRAAQGKIQDLLGRYCARFEVENIKRIIRAKHGQSRQEPDLITVPREQSLVNFPALLKAKDMDEVTSLLRDTPYHPLREKLQSYQESGATMVLEATLDRIYFGRVWELVRSARGIESLVGEEIDLRNLLIAFSLKARETSPRLIEESIIPMSYDLPRATLHSILQTRLEDAPNLLTARYSKLASEAVNLLKRGSSFPLERLFFKRLYADAAEALRTHPLQPGYIVAYLLLCECEAKNLVSIVTGRHLNMSGEEMSQGLFAV